MKISKKFLPVFIVCFLLFSNICMKRYKKYEDKPSRIMSNDILNVIKAEQYEEAEEYFNYLVEKKPYSMNGVRLLEEVYVELASVKNIIEHLNTWCSKSPPHQSAFILRGLYHTNNAWLARGGGYAYTVSDEGWLLFKSRLELAKEDLEKAYSLNPDDPNSASSMIPVLMGLRYEEEEMATWFQRAIKSDPVTYKPYYKKLQFLNPKWRGTVEKHIQFAEHCYHNSPRKSIVYKIMFDCLIEYSKKTANVKKFFSESQIKNILNEIYKRVLKDFPNSIRIRQDFAYAQYKLGKFDEAIRLQTEALTIDPNDTFVLLSRGNIYLDNKAEFKKAELDYKRIIENNPYYPRAKAEAYYRLGEINRLHNRNYKKAIEYQNKAIELNPKEEDYFLMRGFNKIKGSRDFKSALEDFIEAEKIDPRHVYVNHYKSMCLQELKRFDEAITTYQKTLELIEKEVAKGDAGKLNKKQAERLKLQIDNFILLCQKKRTLTNK